jgi:hypothetical protein
MVSGCARHVAGMAKERATRSPARTPTTTVALEDAVSLSAEDVEAVARRTVELLRNERPATFALVDARELAEQLGVNVSFVYDHAAELGAIRLGNGQKARIRFDVERAREALDASRRRRRGRPRKVGAYGG